MRCPRCHEETGPDAARCGGCGAPLALPEEPTARPLDLTLDLDRRDLGGPAGPPRAPRTPPDPVEPVRPAPAPRVPAPPAGVPVTFRRAGSGRRALAWLVDGLPFGLAAVLLVWWLGGNDLELAAPLLAVVGLASFAYQTLSHALVGATLGKRLLGLLVVGPDGRPPGPGRSALRAAVAVAGVALLGIGPLLALFTLSGRALHDLAAGTTVVDAP